MNAFTAQLTAFENNNIRRVYEDAIESWYFSEVDIVAALTGQPD